MADQVDPPPLFENVDIDVEKEDDLFVSAVSAHQVTPGSCFTTILF